MTSNKKHDKPSASPKEAAFKLAQGKFNQGLALHNQGQLVQAQQLYQEALHAQPDHFDALHLSGVIAYQTSRFTLAIELIKQAIAIKPNVAPAYCNLGAAQDALKQHQAAVDSYDKAIALQPRHAQAYSNRGAALNDLGQHQAAIESFNQAIALLPDYPEAYSNRGVALKELKLYPKAIESFQKAIALRPTYASAWANLGAALHESKQYQAAIDSYVKAIGLQPGLIETYVQLGSVLCAVKHYEAAIASFDKATSLQPHHAKAHFLCGSALYEFKQYRAAIESWNKSIGIEPKWAEAMQNCGYAQFELKQYSQALESFDRAWALKPELKFLAGMRLHVQNRICDWRDLDIRTAALIQEIRMQGRAPSPIVLLTLSSSTELQLKAAQIHVKSNFTDGTLRPGAIPKLARHPKIRIGYFSADFHNHATSYLMAQLFEQHRKDKFELFAFSFGPTTKDEMQQRLAQAFDQFIDVQHRTDADIVALSRGLEIDIAVDLKGFTQDSRVGIFAHRAAPIQVNYLGYPGTMGADFIDYLIADKVSIPQNSASHYAEKIAYLPHSYQVNDAKRRISEKILSREELGLPSSGFVFCCFNNNYKIMPSTFDGWMCILQQVDGSVLWLLEDNPVAATNLRKEAKTRGVDPQRLVFAPRLPLSDHLARHRAADLFIDTFPCNAHTTASDALWAGLPVLTCIGESFASRVAASLLSAIGLPELITSTQEEYEAMAIDLATHPERLQAIKQKLERNRLTTPLFDTALFTRHIEDAYTQMHERYHAGLAPDHIYVNP